ncbi:hypothetical protein NHX12_022492 [Muraenolepis orangiensis]|uniref:Uncharacterized protein n=1 Tax=Muraenolepis orangiensis TaxID=630683 RepID=A0A9Q0ERP7_9TELE|nr:hypothetical protein NHX12_022492 [Muraenolepis orangiensis]
MLSLRNTPVTGLNMSPAQMLMGRVLRSTLPCSSAVLKQSTPEHIHDKIQDLQSRQKQHYDQHAKPLPTLTQGATVHMQTRRGWEPAIRQRVEPRSYTVQTPEGRMFRRNRQHLRKIHPSLFKDTHLDEHLDSEMAPAQTPEPVDPPAQGPPHIPPPVSMDSRPTSYTKSARVVRRPARLFRGNYPPNGRPLCRSLSGAVRDRCRCVCVCRCVCRCVFGCTDDSALVVLEIARPKPRAASCRSHGPRFAVHYTKTADYFLTAGAVH